MMRKPLALFLPALLLAACARTPPPSLPPGDVPAAFEQPLPQNAPVWPASDWWTHFGDPQLGTLILAAQSNNLDIAQAEARLRQADARARQAGAALLPTLGLNGNVNSLYGQTGSTSAHETDYSAGPGRQLRTGFLGQEPRCGRCRQSSARRQHRRPADRGA